MSRPLSNMAMLALLRRMKRHDITVHGFRSSFSTWANETAAARPDVIEACLAHRESDKIRAAYNRAQFAAERRKLLEAWAAHLDDRKPVSNVIPLADTNDPRFAKSLSLQRFTCAAGVGSPRRTSAPAPHADSEVSQIKG